MKRGGESTLTKLIAVAIFIVALYLVFPSVQDFLNPLIDQIKALFDQFFQSVGYAP